MIKKHQTLAKGYAQYLYTKPLHAATRKRKLRIMEDYLAFVAQHAGKTHPGTVENQIVLSFLARWRHVKAATYNLYLCDLRGFFGWMEKYDQAKPLLLWLQYKPVKKPLPKDIPLHQMLQLCTPPCIEHLRRAERLRALRDQAIIEVLFSTGIRSLELRRVRFRHLTEDFSECAIISAKSGINHTVYLGKPAREALLAYCAARRIDRSRHNNDFVFPGKNGAMMTGKHLTQIIKRISIRRIGYPVTPHQFRHTFATQMLRASHCIRSVQELLGHRRVDSTANYCHMDFTDRIQAVNKHHPHAQRGEPADQGNDNSEET